MAINNPVESVTKIAVFQPVADCYGTPCGAPYVVGGYDYALNRLQGGATGNSVAMELMEHGYDPTRAANVALHAVASLLYQRNQQALTERLQAYG